MSASAIWNPQPRRPAWGVRTPRRKTLATQTPILVAPPPARVTIPFGNSAGISAKPVVVPGQSVRCGEPIAAPTTAGHPYIHASIVGRVIDIGLYPVAGSSGVVPCIVIERSDSETVWDGYPAQPDAGSLPAAEICQQIAIAGIVGLGGALFPTALKLDSAGAAPLLLLNGAECEAYINCDDMLLRERAERVIAGGQILRTALGAERCVIAIKTDMPEAAMALRDACDAVADPHIVISTVTAKYPAGGERQLIELVFGREVPAGGLPADIGVICQNVGTAAAVADFFLDGRALISRIVTITGGGITRPCNIEARIGTPVADLVELAGGYAGTPERLVMGGPMMGVTLADDALPITAATNCVIAATAGELGEASVELPCIRCGLCVEACPAGLMPQELLRAVRDDDSARLERLGVSECIECGACDYACPSHIRLTEQFQTGKQTLSTAQLSRQQASVARARFEARNRRLADAGNAQPESPVDAESLQALLARSRQHNPGKTD